MPTDVPPRLNGRATEVLPPQPKPVENRRWLKLMITQNHSLMTTKVGSDGSSSPGTKSWASSTGAGLLVCSVAFSSKGKQQETCCAVFDRKRIAPMCREEH